MLCRIEQLKAEGIKQGIKLFDIEKDSRRAAFPEDKLIQSFYDRYPSVSVLHFPIVSASRKGLKPRSQEDKQLLAKHILDNEATGKVKTSIVAQLTYSLHLPLLLELLSDTSLKRTTIALKDWS